MDYYEELGLSRTASAEDIRRAYKNLARLLHPDQQQDPELRRLAECQMKRLNAVTAILTDAAERRRYDRELLLPMPAEARPIRSLFRSLAFHQQWVWLAAAAIGTAGLLSYFRSSPGPRADVARARVVATPEATQQQAATGPPAVRARRHIPKARRPEPAPVTTVESESPPTLPSPAIPSATPDLNVHPAAAFVAVPPPAPRPIPRGLAGNWFYAPSKVAEAAEALYPPEFIEMVISTEGRVLSGRYRARYKVSDRAISPEVVFQFRGRASGERADLEWTAGGGGRGRVELRLLSEHRLEVTWSASTLGTSLGLASGTAVLMRRLEF